MKSCPNCKSEVDDNFELCWKCNYSFSQKKIITIDESISSGDKRKIDCLRCKIPMKYNGEVKLHEGFSAGFFGDFFEAMQNKQSFDIYYCSNCSKVEFFVPGF